ncbi:MAG: PD40 domain-containing protein, partial [Actinobacteria bacterium]|nr:PD40 domain-containing protein [Actinomycetota bacterium]
LASPLRSEVLYTQVRTDGSRPLLLQAGGDIYSLRPGGEPERLTNSAATELWARWSPGGGRIILARSGAGSSDLFTLRPGSKPKRLTRTASQENYPDWSPDGSKIVFSSKRRGDWDLYTYSFRTSSVQRLLSLGTDEFEPAWSSSGRRIVFHVGSGGEDIFSVGADGSGLRRITRLSNGSRARAAEWLDSDRLITEFIQGDKIGCRIIHLSGKIGRWIGSNGDYRCTPSPDRRSLAVQRLRGGAPGRVIRVSLQNESRSALAPFGVPLDW